MFSILFAVPRGGLLAIIVNDNACALIQSGALESIASKPAPTGGMYFHQTSELFISAALIKQPYWPRSFLSCTEP